MKEYISKKDLLKIKTEINMHAKRAGSVNLPFNFIDELPTVTKADICREFIEYVKFCDKTYMKPQIVREPEYYKGYKDAFNFFEQILSEMDIENSILAEMEG